MIISLQTCRRVTEVQNSDLESGLKTPGFDVFYMEVLKADAPQQSKASDAGEDEKRGKI